MDINDLFEGIMKGINQFADEVAEERARAKRPVAGRDPESEGRLEGHGWPERTAARLVRQDA